jgi:hypothetical protein
MPLANGRRSALLGRLISRVGGEFDPERFDKEKVNLLLSKIR